MANLCQSIARGIPSGGFFKQTLLDERLPPALEGPLRNFDARLCRHSGLPLPACQTVSIPSEQNGEHRALTGVEAAPALGGIGWSIGREDHTGGDSPPG